MNLMFFIVYFTTLIIILVSTGIILVILAFAIYFAECINRKIEQNKKE